MHPDLPKAPIIAAVSYVLGSPSTADPMEMVGIGVQFQGMDDEARKALNTWVSVANMAQPG
jgi:hypothetical protein